MKTIIFITGLPASGKSTYGFVLAKKLNYFLLDNDPSYLSIQDHSPYYDIVAISSSFCLKQNRERITKLLSNNIVKWVAFENDPTACYKNSHARHKVSRRQLQPLADLITLSKLYTYPENCEIIPVWS